MSLLRKARRAAEKQKKSVEKARKKEAQKQENIYRKNRSFAGLFNSEEERDKCLEKLLARYKRGEKLTLREADLMCFSMYPEDQTKYSICDDTRFTTLYLRHFDARINGHSLTDGDQKQLNDFAKVWEAKVWDEAMSGDRVYIETRKETKETIKKMRKSLTDSGLSPEEISIKEKEIILRSKNTYIKVNQVLENTGSNELSLNLCGKEVHIDEFTLIHTFFRHYSELTKQYDDNKSHFTPEIYLDQLPIILKEKILEPIEKSGVLGGDLPQSIFIKYFGRLYRIYFNEKSVNSGHATVMRVNTFYPVDQEKDLQDSKKYHFRKVGNNLHIGVLPT